MMTKRSRFSYIRGILKSYPEIKKKPPERMKMNRCKYMECGCKDNCLLKDCIFINQAIAALKRAEKACAIIEILSEFSIRTTADAENNTNP